MTAQQRLNALLELVTNRGSVSIEGIEHEFGVSAATARRDLNVLAEQRLVTRTHGGATALGASYELPLQYKISRQAEAKTAIANTVAELIAPGSTVGVNGGTTTTEIARALGRSKRFAGADLASGVTIVTNALNVAFEMSIRPNVKIVVTGGVARRQSYELVGPVVGRTLDEFTLDVAVLGVDGLSAQYGATTMEEAEAEVARRFASVARRVIVAADATKIGRATFARICPLTSVDTFVTDTSVDGQFADALATAGVELVVADT